ncbi:cocaine esterase-like [Panulirus ornatus]|uniref:cocaine esterase-like n=1 Tax=Panulirus ornatus TaxID=150431 RepID=UPI003A8AF9AF
MVLGSTSGSTCAVYLSGRPADVPVGVAQSSWPDVLFITVSRMTVSAVLLAAVLSVARVWAQDAPVVATQEGRVSGIQEESTKGKVFYSYYGIPFAKPPLGDLRLKDPVAAESWDGLLDGSAMPEPCLQAPFSDTAMGVKTKPENLIGKEDCLYVNVFTPKPTDEEAKLPVMVWIHGGGYFSGGAHEYLPHVLLNHDIVLVVLQYRLGIMGFLSTEDSVIPGNFGLKDQTLALQWVQRNIHNFGGDKTRVTIFGESAGGASVHLLVLSPKTDGLFNRAIMQSGSALSPWGFTWSYGEQLQHVTTKTGCPTDQGSEALLVCLQGIDDRELAALYQAYFGWFILPCIIGPRVDGDFIPDDPGRMLREGRYKKVDVMTGVTSDEGALFTKPMYVQKEIFNAIETNFSVMAPVVLQCQADNTDPPSVARRIFRHYLGEGKLDPEAQSEELTRMMTDRHMMVDNEMMVMQHVKNPATGNTFRYVLTHRGELSFGDFFPSDVGSQWVSHLDDLYYLFRGGRMLQPPHQPPQRPRDLREEEDLAVRDIMTALWTNFAAKGNPTPDDSLGFIWEPFTKDDHRYLVLKPTPMMEADQRQEVRKFHASLPTKMNFALNPELVQEEVEM